MTLKTRTTKGKQEKAIVYQITITPDPIHRYMDYGIAEFYIPKYKMFFNLESGVNKIHSGRYKHAKKLGEVWLSTNDVLKLYQLLQLKKEVKPIINKIFKIKGSPWEMAWKKITYCQNKIKAIICK